MKTLFELIENNQKTFFSSTKKMLITSNFVWEIWHYKIRVEDFTEPDLVYRFECCHWEFFDMGRMD